MEEEEVRRCGVSEEEEEAEQEEEEEEEELRWTGMISWHA